MRVSRKQAGFTLVELAIVLVIIGLILGMAFKGKDLIDSAKVKTIRAQYDKIITGLNIYYERNSRYPGDGCADGATTLADCPANKRNGLIASGPESKAAIKFLTEGNILSKNDMTGPNGVEWGFIERLNRSWAYLENLDQRFICAVDQQMDDGKPGAGVVRYAANNNNPENNPDATNPYSPGFDCWSLSGNGRLYMAVLP